MPAASAEPAERRAELAARLAPQLDRAYLLARRVLGNSALAEDAVQEALLRSLSRPAAPADSGDAAGGEALFLRVVHDSAVDIGRNEAARRAREERAMSEAERHAGPAPGVDQAVARGEAAQAARRELDGLPAELRTAICLCCEEGLTQKEAAVVLGVPLGTVARRVQRGLDALRERMGRMGYSAISAAALTEMLGSLGIPPAPGGLMAALAEMAGGPAAQGTGAAAGAAKATSAASTLKGGLAMKVGLGVAAMGLAAGATFWAAGGGRAADAPAACVMPAAATSEVPRGNKDYEYTTLDDTFHIEWACFTGVVEHLDGPGREGMGRQMGGSSTQGCLRGMQSDDAGNLYMVDMTGGCLRVLRKRDRMLQTVSGNTHMTAGRAPEKEGPAYALNLDQMVYLAATGDPLSGKGSLYATPENRVVRLFRNEAKGGMWWYEVVAGGGKTTMTGPQEYGALDANLREPRVITTKDGRVGVTRVVGGANDKRQILYWLKDGKLAPAYDEAAVKAAAGGYFSCYGLDGAGNFAGCVGNNIVTVEPDGKTVKRNVKTPFSPVWGVYPDRNQECWFIKSMDHYTITRVTPDGKTVTLKEDGAWHVHKEGDASRAYNIGDGVQWMWCLPLQDSRMVGWNSHGCLPLFVGTWLEGK